MRCLTSCSTQVATLANLGERLVGEMDLPASHTFIPPHIAFLPRVCLHPPAFLPPCLPLPILSHPDPPHAAAPGAMTAVGTVLEPMPIETQGAGSNHPLLSTKTLTQMAAVLDMGEMP